ncbi:HPF/RaiA family ribosome-associated protein [bacterium]|nr:HPF/RaiA family ribosome-associated protein [bacterium]
MIKIKFKNLDQSEMAREAVTERINVIIEKFPDLQNSKIDVTLEMENSPFKAGPDAFLVKVFVHTGRYKGITVSKTNPNLYVALADLVDNMLEKLNRFGDKVRIKERNKARKLAQQKEPGADYVEDEFI